MLPAHSKFSASASKRWLSCAGSMVLTAGLPDTSSKYADEGTKAHAMAEATLRGEDYKLTDADVDMWGHVSLYVDNIKQYAEGGELMVEQKLNYAKYLGLPTEAAWGTSDAVIAKGDEIQVHDLKYGMGEVVSPENNPQMMLYALGALAAFDDLAGPFKRVRMVIHQPRVVKAPQEWDCSVEELLAFGEEAKRAVHLVKAAEFGVQTKTQAEWEAEYLKPGADQCRWCKAKATCPKLRAEVSDAVFATVPATAEDFADLSVPGPAHIAPATEEWLSVTMAKADLIEDWLKAVRAEVERRLLAGGTVPGYKVVQGKQGNRAWADTAKAEALLKSFRLKVEDMYDMKVISPTSAEKVLAESPKRWAKAQELITRADGKLSVAPLSDKRPAVKVTPVAEDFTDLSVADDLG
jgi:hypothetical protein